MFRSKPETMYYLPWLSLTQKYHICLCLIAISNLYQYYILIRCSPESGHAQTYKHMRSLIDAPLTHIRCLSHSLILYTFLEYRCIEYTLIMFYLFVFTSTLHRLTTCSKVRNVLPWQQGSLAQLLCVEGLWTYCGTWEKGRIDKYRDRKGRVEK